jgi:energy-converting hydrogenase Eha subunit E
LCEYNEAIITTLVILLAVSEILSLIPSLKSNGIIQMVLIALRAVLAITKKKEEK